MAVVLEGGAVAMAMAPSPGTARSKCSSQVVAAASPLGVSSCSNRLALPTCRGLKAVRFGGVARRVSAVRPASKHAMRDIVCEAQETIGGTGQVTDQTFKSLVLDSDVPVLVDFWAPWCGPCRMIAPIIDELAKQYAGKIRCLKLNTDESPYIATEYGIRSIPTVMIFKRGEKKDTVIGAVPRATLSATIDKHLDW